MITPATPISRANVVVSANEIDDDVSEEVDAAGTTGARVGPGVASTSRDTTGTTFASATIKFGTLMTVAKCFNN